MKLTFQCLAITHTSGRVTLTPLTVPAFAVHAPSLEQARFELTLALDDKVGRVHPRHLWRYVRAGDGALIELPVGGLPVQRGSQPVLEPVVLRAIESAVHAGHREVRLPTADLRFWFASKGKALTAEACALLAEHLKLASPDELLRLRAEGDATIVDVEVPVTPLKLSQLARRELLLDERPPPKGLDELTPGEDEDDDAPDDDWSDEGKRKKKEKPAGGPPTPTLDRLAVKWHQLAKDDAFAPTFGRDALVEQVLAHVALKDPEPLVLVGAAGVGKTAVLHEVARRLVPKTSGTPSRPFFLLDGSRLIAGGGFFGEWQQQTLEAFAEATAAKVVLHLGRLVDLIDAGRSAHSDDNVAQLITPMLAAREVTAVAEATPEEWARLSARNQSFARLFSPLVVEEPAPDVTRDIVARVGRAEATARLVEPTLTALDEVRSLVRRFRPSGSPLGNTLAFLRRLIDGCDVGQRLEPKDVIRRFSIESGIPEELLRDDVSIDPAEVRAFLSARVKGQPDAVARVAEVVSVIKANLTDPARPVATLLFAGPTGVGKTELTKALAERVFGSKDRLVRLDMGEYSGADALARLVGDGGEDGFLSTAVRRQPFSVVLLDEIEKAHPAVFDALLSVLGEGRLTDGRGRTTDFRSALIVMTSNLGAQTQRPRVGFGDEGSSAARTHVLGEIRRFFRPEFFNRLDDVIVFAPLGPAELSSIVERELGKVAGRSGLSRLDVTVSIDAASKQALAEWGHEPRYGARPLKRAIERRLVVPAAAHLAAHPPAGPSELRVTRTGDALDFTLTPAGRGTDAASRAELLAVCEKAATLRGEVAEWAGAPLMARMRDDFRLFERLSRQPSFWKDRALADAEARRAGAVREVDEGFTKLKTQIEAVEELAFEAYATRERRSATELESTLDAQRAELHPLTERLFASRFPGVEAATVVLVPGRSSLRWAEWLRTGYVEWAKGRGLRVESLSLLPVPGRGTAPVTIPKTSRDRVERTLQQQGLTAAARVYRDKHDVPLDEAVKQVKAIERRLAAAAAAVPSTTEWKLDEAPEHAHAEALAVRVFGPWLPMLLSSEHGLHRVYDGGESFEVKVHFGVGAAELPRADTFEAMLPNTEIRRVWPTRRGHEFGVLKDHRTSGEHRVEGTFHYAPVLAAYVRHVVFEGKGAAWS
ncbi:MAG: AAA family ATPase [Myxococcaceae bacterium]|nr:AAA family ATPase [Myxococcaceae bacterium]